MADYLILRAVPNPHWNIIPEKTWDGNNGMLYLERDIVALIKRHVVSTRKTKYGMSYHFKTLKPYSEEARLVY